MKYKDLVEAWKKSRQDWYMYRDSVLNIVSKIATGLAKHLDIPNNDVFKFYSAEHITDDDYYIIV